MRMLNLNDLVNEFVSVMVTHVVVVDAADVVVVVVVVVAGVNDDADLNDVAKVFVNFHLIDHWQHKQQPLQPLLHFVVAAVEDVLGRVNDVVVNDFVHCQLLNSMIMMMMMMMMAQCQLEASVLHLLAMNCHLNDKAILVKIVC